MLVLVFIAPSLDFIFLFLRIIFLLLRSIFDVLSMLPLLVVWSVEVVGLPALGMLEGLPVWAPGAVPGATVWAWAALAARAKAVAKIREAFMGKRKQWVRKER